MFVGGICTTSVFANPPSLPVVRRFQHTYGNPTTYERSERAPGDYYATMCHPLERAKDGGYIMVGSQGDYLGAQILTVRATITGSHLGADRTYAVSGTAGTQGSDICTTSDGGYAILGNCGVYIPVGGSSFPGDIVVVKTDGAGSVLWKKRYGGTNWGGTCRDQAYSIIQTTDGGYMVAGYTECPPGDPTGFGDLLLLKLKSDGSIDWHKEYNDFHWNYVAYSVVQTSDGGYAIAGKLSKYTGGIQAFIMKVKSDGTSQWFKEFGTPGTTDEFYSVAIAADGGYIASGKMGGDIYVVKTFSSGALDWAKTYGGAGGTTDIGYDVKRTGTNFLVAGVANNSKAFLMRLKSDGTIDFAKAYAPPGATSVARSVVVTDQGYAISGDVSTGNSDYYLVKTDGNGDSFCNTENLTLSTLPQSDGAWISMSTPGHSYIVSTDPTQNTVALGESQLCYKEEQVSIINDATLHDQVFAHSFLSGIKVDDGGTINDPTWEPAQLDAHAWTSEGIWLRAEQDKVLSDRTNGHLYEHELINENARFDLGTNYIYVLVTNHGDAATDPGTLDVYWSVTSTNLTWPTHWINYVPGADGTVYGDLAGTAQIPAIGPGESYVAEIPWTTPDPAAYGGTTPSVSLLARFQTDSDPIAISEDANTEGNAINNNNIAWRNVVLVSDADMAAGQAGGTKTIVIRNTSDQEGPADLSLSIPSEEVGINPLFGQGNVYVDLGAALYQQWLQAGRPGTNVEDNQDGTIKILGDDASIGITLPANSEAAVGIRFESTGEPLTLTEYYHYDVVQSGGIGGVTFELQFPASDPDAQPGTKTVIAPNKVDAGIAGAILTAQPNPTANATVISYRLPVATPARLAIYDVTGNLVRVLVTDEEIMAGTHEVLWDGTNSVGTRVGSGVYIYRLETPLGVISRQLTIVR